MPNELGKLTDRRFKATAENKAPVGAVPELADLPTWNLSDLYPGGDSDEYRADLSSSRSEAEAFSNRYAGNLESLLNSAPEKLASAIAEYEAIEEKMTRVMSFAVLTYTGETTDPDNAKLYGDAQEKITEASASLLFFPLEINRLDGDLLDSAMQSCAPLGHYRPWLDDLRKDKPYQLEDRIETLFHEKSITGPAAWNRLFDEMLASLRFTVDGEEQALEPTLNLLQHKDRKTRQAAAIEIGSVLRSNERIFTLITNTLAKDKEISDRWRGFKDIADSRHLSNRVEREVVEALTEAVQQSLPDISHRYYAMKAKWLGLETMQHWDRNAPLPTTDERLFSWQEAEAIVLEAYGGFAPQMADIARNFFDKNWIDAPSRLGKSPGAFAHPTVPSAHPYILLNYLGKPRDVTTLAHELGHGVHQVLAADQGLLMSQTPLTLAETASVFGEMLTFQSLLDKCTNATERKALLVQKVEDMINTVVRQITFYIFERKLHTARMDGELTAEAIGNLWIEVQGDSLGPVFEFDDSYRSYWSYIPHFIHSPFYVYAYAFGDCLVNSLYAVYKNSETGFQEKYFEMLKAGGTKHHTELLAPFGLNAADPDFWQRGLSVISSMIDEIETIDNENQ